MLSPLTKGDSGDFSFCGNWNYSLTLRGVRQGYQLTQGGERRVERIEIELGFQGKMIQRGSHFQPLQFDKAAQGGKEMIGLGRDRLRGGLRQRDILFERLVITLHLPSCVIGRGQVVH